MRLRFFTLDVFTDRRFGGNPLAVFPEAKGLDGETMQLIARELNLSETVFVLPPADPAHAARLRIFTPAAEVPFAGHPTVGTAHLLAALGPIRLSGETTRAVLEEGVGPVPVEIRARDGKPVFAQLSVARLPEQGPPPPSRAAIAATLSLVPTDLDPEVAPAAFSCGLPFLFVPLASRDALARARVDPAAVQSALGGYCTQMLFPFTLDTGEAGVDVRARMFAPSMGVPEDPATGSAAAALAGLLAARDRARDGTLRWTVAQGIEMGRPSRIEVEADVSAGCVAAVRVGGASVLVSEGMLDASRGA